MSVPHTAVSTRGLGQVRAPTACPLNLALAQRSVSSTDDEALSLANGSIARIRQSSEDGAGSAPWRPPDASLERGCDGVASGQRGKPRTHGGGREVGDRKSTRLNS